MRSLRFRLTISYVLIFWLLLMVVGFTFRSRLQNIITERVQDSVNSDWSAAKGLVHLESGRVTWSVDRRDNEQTLYLERLRRFLLIANEQGEILEMSPSYRSYSPESADEIRARFTADNSQLVFKEQGSEVALFRYGVIRSGGKPYLLVIGRRITDFGGLPDALMKDYYTILPLVLLVTFILGWFMAGRALRPVTKLAETAQRISASSLHLRIPPLHAKDELDQLIVAFNKMMERLSVNFDQIRGFSTDVSHELRTPLTGIRGQLEVALLTAKTPDEFRDAIANALEDVDRISNIVRALLLLSQAETGQLSLQKQPVDLSEVVAELVEQFDISASESGVDLRGDLQPNVIISGDRTQMDRLVANLLANALKYTPSGGHVRILVRNDGESAILTVADDGKGIPPASIPHIFDRFYRVPDADPNKGLGLGLSFVSWIVKAHNGRIDLSSEVGLGTTFTIRIPLKNMYGASPGPAADSNRMTEARQ